MAITPRTVRRGDLVPVLWSVGLPFWIISLGMTYLGVVLAREVLLPEVRGILALLATGPLLTGATCLYNDVVDRRADIHNPRKGSSALLVGRLQTKEGLKLARLLAALCLLCGLLLGVEVLLLLSAALLLSFLYSNPGARLKTKPPWDVVVNVVGIGALLPLIGWASVRPLEQFPWHFLLTTLLGISGLYLLTVALDLPADSRAGLRSTAVAIGAVSTLRAAVLAVGMTGVALVLVAHRWPNDPLPPQLLDMVWPMFVVQLIGMGVLLRQPKVRRVMATIIFLGILYVLGVGAFVVGYGSTLLAG